MVCYSVTAVAAIICYAFRKVKNKTQPQYFWLNLMLFGGAIFGVVDHLWNGELLLIGENWAVDLALGFAILAVILVAWSVMVVLPSPSLATTKSAGEN